MEQKKHPAKEKAVKELAKKISDSKTLMIVSIKSLPSKQFQEIKKSIREYAQVKVSKKNIILRAIKELKKESILPLNDYVKEDSALIISNLEGFELAGILAKKKNSVFAKAGQIAPLDLEVKEGPTDLVPGPAISELGALGIQISVENGKIVIKKPKVIIKEGEVINGGAASILQKLNIQPFKVGLEPIAVYDVQTGKIFTNIKIDSEETKKELISAASKALGFAQKIVYYCKETIGYFLAKANSEADALNKLQPKEERKEESKEQKQENAEEDKEKTNGGGN